jgi:hypothetical protein
MGEIVGAVAVVVTLFVLVFQLRQNTAEVRASTVQSLQDKSIDLFAEGMLSELPEILAKNNKDEPLTDAEYERYCLFIRRNLQFFEQVFIQNSQGRIGGEVMAAYNRRMAAHFSFRFWPEIWTELKPLMTESFQTHMESLGDP